MDGYPGSDLETEVSTHDAEPGKHQVANQLAGRRTVTGISGANNDVLLSR